MNLIVIHLELDNQGRQDIETLVKEARPLQYITCETLYTTLHTCVVSTYTSSTSCLKKDDHVLKTNNMLLPQCPHVPPPFSSRARKSQHHRCRHASPAHSPSASSLLCLLQVGELDSHLGNSEKKVINRSRFEVHRPHITSSNHLGGSPRALANGQKRRCPTTSPLFLSELIPS